LEEIDRELPAIVSSVDFLFLFADLLSSCLISIDTEDFVDLIVLAFLAFFFIALSVFALLTTSSFVFSEGDKDCFFFSLFGSFDLRQIIDFSCFCFSLTCYISYRRGR